MGKRLGVAFENWTFINVQKGKVKESVYFTFSKKHFRAQCSKFGFYRDKLVTIKFGGKIHPIGTNCGKYKKV